MSVNRFHQNCFSELFVKREARVAHQANDVVMTGEQLHDPVFAKADLAQPIA